MSYAEILPMINSMYKSLGKLLRSFLNKLYFSEDFNAFLFWRKQKNNEILQKILFNKNDFIDLEEKNEKNLLLEQYRILNEQVNKASENRESLNNFWITLNGAIMGGISYVKDMQIDNSNPKNLFIGSLIFFGFIFSVFWMQALGKIGKDIEIKNQMVMEMEKFLPAKIFTTSFQIKTRAREKGSLSSTERKIPFLFCLGYILIALIALYYPNIV